MTGPETSTTLLQELRHRKADAWRRFVELYCPIAYRLARKKGLDRDAADTVVQEFCIRMVKRLPTFDYDPSKGRFRKWVLTVALNEIRRYLRSAAVRQRGVSVIPPDELPDEPAAVEDEHWWESAERTRLFQLALDELKREVSPRDYDIFVRLVLEERPVAELATAHQMTANHVYGVKFRMLQRVRSQAQRLARELHGV